MKDIIIPTLGNSDQENAFEYLNNSIEAFSEITGIPVTFFNENNDIIKEYKKDDKICSIFDVYSAEAGPCRRNLSDAGRFASRLGTPHIFLCKAGLANIAVSLTEHEKFAGYFVAGPIVMEELKENTINSFEELNQLNEMSLSMAKMFAGKMKVYQKNQISQLALLFYNSIATAVSEHPSYSALCKNRPSEQILTRREHSTTEYPYELEKLLIDSVNEGQVLLAKSNILDLLDSFMDLEDGDLDGVKTKALWLFAIITRKANEHSNLNQNMDSDLDVIDRINAADSFDELCNVCEELIEHITESVVPTTAASPLSMLTPIYNGHHQTITNALQFINKNFRDNISLKDISSMFDVNSSYFSTLFKQEMSVTFTDYLNSVKIAHACQLLATTNLSSRDIAQATGFEDQSYFTKVFKKVMGMLPKEYRSSLSNKAK